MTTFWTPIIILFNGRGLKIYSCKISQRSQPGYDVSKLFSKLSPVTCVQGFAQLFNFVYEPLVGSSDSSRRVSVEIQASHHFLKFPYVQVFLNPIELSFLIISPNCLHTKSPFSTLWDARKRFSESRFLGQMLGSELHDAAVLADLDVVVCFSGTLEAVVYFLILLSEFGNVFGHAFRGVFVDYHAFDELRNFWHLIFLHPQPCNF